jgi:hypothetical protein
MNLGWFSHYANQCISGIGKASARWRTVNCVLPSSNGS